MMRELKFRTYDFVMQRYDDAPEIYATTDGHLEPSSNKIIEQYTMLKDKNGKEIYDGDIVSVWGCTYKVAFLDNAGMIIVEKIPDGSISQSQMLLANCCFECEIIGNIHENKELLGSEK